MGGLERRAHPMGGQLGGGGGNSGDSAQNSGGGNSGDSAQRHSTRAGSTRGTSSCCSRGFAHPSRKPCAATRVDPASIALFLPTRQTRPPRRRHRPCVADSDTPQRTVPVASTLVELCDKRALLALESPIWTKAGANCIVHCEETEFASLCPLSAVGGLFSWVSRKSATEGGVNSRCVLNKQACSVAAPVDTPEFDPPRI